MFKANKIKHYFLITILSLIFIYTRFIVDIDIINENSSYQKLITVELEKNNIKEYQLIKSNKKLNNIKNIIITKNKELIEWLNIERVGMKYIIKLQPKINKNTVEDTGFCNIVSEKDGVITRIISSKGTELVDVNDSIKKQDILISGNISLNEETKKQVCAEGEVYAKTWYTINISTTKTYEEKIKQKQFRYNLVLKHNNKNTKIFKSRIENPINENKKIFDFFGYKLYLQKEYSSKTKISEYDEKSLENKINSLVDEKMKTILQGDYKILERKVLKKEENDSKIDIEIFIVAEEEIGTTITIEPENILKNELE